MSKLSKLDEPLAVEFFRILTLRIRGLKNDIRRHKKQGAAREVVAGYEKALSELLEAYRLSDIAMNHHIFAPLNILERKGFKEKRVSLSDFNAVKHLVHATPERIEALKMVLVDGKTYQAAADKFGWSRQAVHQTITLFYDAMERRADKVLSIYPPEHN
jgi:predicted DNA-binding protein (UPF0251 family)